MIGHLGTQVSALLDGQMSVVEEERAWQHVHGCHECRDQVEREGWIKTELAGLTWRFDAAPARLKGSLLAPDVLCPGDAFLVVGRPRPRSMVALGGGALGVAVVGVLALGAAPASAPAMDRRAPVTSLVRPAETPRVAPSADRRVGTDRPEMTRLGAAGVTIPW